MISCNKNICTLQITDTTGSHQFPAMQRLSISKGHAFILVYSVSSRQSLEELRPIWELIKEIKGPDLTQIPVMLVGNKCDESAELREVSLIFLMEFLFRKNDFFFYNRWVRRKGRHRRRIGESVSWRHRRRPITTWSNCFRSCWIWKNLGTWVCKLVVRHRVALPKINASSCKKRNKKKLSVIYIHVPIVLFFWFWGRWWDLKKIAERFSLFLSQRKAIWVTKKINNSFRCVCSLIPWDQIALLILW